MRRRWWRRCTRSTTRRARARFTIRPEQEDGHTALEAALVERVGEAGRRIHLGRSRNDQVQLALRLLLREEVLALGARTAELAGPSWTSRRRTPPCRCPATRTCAAPCRPPSACGASRSPRDCWRSWRRCAACGPGWTAARWAPRRASACRCPSTVSTWPRCSASRRVQRSPIDVQNSRGRHETAALGWACSVAGRPGEVAVGRVALQHRGVRLPGPAGCLHHGLVHHAAEEEPGRGGAGARPLPRAARTRPSGGGGRRRPALQLPPRLPAAEAPHPRRRWARCGSCWRCSRAWCPCSR